MSDQFVPGLAGVPAAKSAIGLIDGQQGILRYRGIRIEALAEQSTFEEVTYLLLFGKLPTSDELASFTAELAGMRSLPAEVVSVLKALPKDKQIAANKRILVEYGFVGGKSSVEIK